MSCKSKIILTVTIVFFSTLLLALPQSAMARDGRGGGRFASRSRTARSRLGRSHRGRTRTSRGYGGFGRSQQGRRGFGGSSIGLSFGFSDNYYSSSSRQWVPGYYQTHTEQVLVEPGHYELQIQQVQIEPERYEIRQVPAVEQTRHDDEGKAYQVVVEPARTETIRIPAKYEQIEVKVWVPDRYETRQVRTWVPGHWVSQPVRSPARSWLNLGAIFNFRF